MLLRNPILFAILFPIVAFGASGTFNDSRAESGVPKPSPSFVPVQSKEPKDLAVGKILVANRGLGDPRFARTVILLVHFDDQGVLGLVLNRRTTVPISQVLDLKAAKDRADPVWLGGPVEPAAVFGLLQSSAKPQKAEAVFSGVYLISDKDLFEQTIASKPDPNIFHVYLGYAGWTPDQLRAEVKLGAWFIFPADVATVFNSNADPNTLWLQMIQKTEFKLAKVERVRESKSPRTTRSQTPVTPTPALSQTSSSSR